MRPALTLISFGIFLLICTGWSVAAVRRVPQDYATIQSALNALEDGDTVLISLGTYAEQLVAPPRSQFVIRGDVVPDTGDYPRPIIDPSSLPRPDTVACLRTDPLTTSILIEDLVFRNGRAMYDTIPRYIGGISDHSQDLTLRRCLFDSTYGGVSAGNRLNLIDCHFLRNRTICARTDAGPIQAEHCIFSCNGGGGQNVSARGGSSFRHCHFRDNQAGHLLVTGGDSVIVEDCIFGPYGPLRFNPIEVLTEDGTVFRRNLFVDCGLGQALLNVVLDDCNAQPRNPISIAQNVFRDYYGGEGQGGVAIHTLCYAGNPPAYFGVIEDNVFEDGVSAPLWAPANALDIMGRIDIRRNRFTRLEPDTVPDVTGYRIDSGPNDSLILRDNLFDATGLAASATEAVLDARYNWWGHETGPYHPSLHPDGRGGEIGSHVMFEPWYTDTNFVAPEHPAALHPNTISIAAYPNPFNSSAQLVIRVPRPANYQVRIFNLLGREVHSVWHGEIRAELTLRIEGRDLSSGLHLARVEATDRSTAATAKLLLLK